MSSPVGAAEQQQRLQSADQSQMMHIALMSMSHLKSKKTRGNPRLKGFPQNQTGATLFQGWNFSGSHLKPSPFSEFSRILPQRCPPHDPPCIPLLGLLPILNPNYVASKASTTVSSDIRTCSSSELPSTSSMHSSMIIRPKTKP